MQHEGHENVRVLMPQGRGMRRENPILPAYFACIFSTPQPSFFFQSY